MMHFILWSLMARNRANDLRNQITKIAILAVLAFLSLFGLVNSLEAGAWYAAPLFVLTFAQSALLLNASTEGYLFLRRLMAGG